MNEACMRAVEAFRLGFELTSSLPKNDRDVVCFLVLSALAKMAADPTQIELVKRITACRARATARTISEEDAIAAKKLGIHANDGRGQLLRLMLLGGEEEGSG